MDGYEITLARAYLAASDNDPIAALIRSVKDLARAYRAATPTAARQSASVKLVARENRAARAA